MVGATISRARLRGLTRLGRSRGRRARCAGPSAPCASVAEQLADATSIAEPLGDRPRAASPRPEAGDLMASTT